jgi:hypothetical protein
LNFSRFIDTYLEGLYFPDSGISPSVTSHRSGGRLVLILVAENDLAIVVFEIVVGLGFRPTSLFSQKDVTMQYIILGFVNYFCLTRHSSHASSGRGFSGAR